MTIGHYICSVKRKIHREDIVKTGMELMFLNGYNATSIKEITDSIEIPKGSFYNHFTSKEEFGLEVLEEYCNNGISFHEKMLLNNTSTPLKRLKKHYSEMINHSKKVNEFKLGCFMSNSSTELADVNENFRQLLDEKFSAIESIIAACIAEGQTQGEINDSINASNLASFILNSWHGALVRMKSTGNIKPLEDFENFIFNQILK